jgi:hypothetical protein
MMPGTSPSIHGLLSGGYQVAFQANTGDLWVLGTSWTGDTGPGMAPGTSPFITVINSSYEVAFQANNYYLYTWNNLTGPSYLGFGMMPRTSPSITGLWTGGAEIAFQANNGNLWNAGSDGTGGNTYGIAPGTSPPSQASRTVTSARRGASARCRNHAATRPRGRRGSVARRGRAGWG